MVQVTQETNTSKYYLLQIRNNLEGITEGLITFKLHFQHQGLDLELTDGNGKITQIFMTPREREIF